MAPPPTRPLELAVRELAPCLGAEVSGVILQGAGTLSPPTPALLQDALDQHGVLVFRGLRCTDAEHVRFARAFGPVEPPLSGDPAASPDGEPVFVMSNVDGETGELFPPADVRVRYADGNALWHSDGSFRPDPLRASLLSAKAVAPAGQGGTEFASLTAAYAALSSSRQAQLEGLEAEYSLSNSRRQLKKAAASMPAGEYEKQSETKEIGFSSVPAVRHPIVRMHPRTGAKALHVGSYCERIVGMDEAEGKALLAELLEWSTQPRFCYKHSWTVGDMLVYDNISTLHRARPWQADRYKRTLHRVTIAGGGGDSGGGGKEDDKLPQEAAAGRPRL